MNAGHFHIYTPFLTVAPGWYFAVMGVGSVWKVKKRLIFECCSLELMVDLQTSTALLRIVLGKERWKSFDRTRVLILKNKRGELGIFDRIDN